MGRICRSIRMPSGQVLAGAITVRFGEAFDIWQLSSLPLGLSGEHAGTLSLSVTGMTALLRVGQSKLKGEIAAGAKSHDRQRSRRQPRPP